MDDQCSIDVTLDWNNCLTEILLEILQYLDPTSLISCMTVNQHWKNLAYVVCKKYGWQQVAEQGLFNKGVDFKNKSALDWKEIVENFSLWQNVQHSKVYHISKDPLNENHIKNLFIYKDKLVFVSVNDVRYYDVETYECVKKLYLPIPHFEESEHIFVMSDKSYIYAIGKFRSDKIFNNDLNKYTLSVSLFERFKDHTKTLSQGPYLLYDDCFYIIKNKGELWMYKWANRNWSETFIARHYGIKDAVETLHIHNGQVYCMSKWGDLWRVNTEHCFEKLLTFELHPVRKSYKYKTVLIGILSSFLSDRTASDCAAMKIEDIAGEILTFLDRTDLSCIKLHGGILFAGNYNRTVEIHTFATNSGKLVLRRQKIFTIDDVVDPHLMTNVVVKDILVYESKNSHCLIVHVGGFIHLVLLLYPEYIIY